MDRVRILDIYIDNLEWDRIANVVEGFIRSQKAHQIISANSMMLSALEKEPELKETFLNADLVLADSIGVVWASRFLGFGEIARIAGIDLMLNFCRLADSRGYSIYLLGSRPFVLRKAAGNLEKKFPGLRIVGMHHGYFVEGEESGILEGVRNHKPDFLFVGIGTPRGEKWIYKNLKKLNVPVCMAIGGSLDVISGGIKRAPGWLRQKGLEWIYRLLQEPWRFFRLPALLCFVWKTMEEKLRR